VNTRRDDHRAGADRAAGGQIQFQLVSGLAAIEPADLERDRQFGTELLCLVEGAPGQRLT